MRSTPYSEGDPKAQICFIAEAPSTFEILHSRPLVGPAGKIHNECLHEAGIIRATTSTVNVIKHKIKDTKPWINGKGQLTDKGHAAAKELKARLGGYKANIYVPLGNLALACMTGFGAITKHRGSIYDSTLLAGRKVMGTFHPASVLPGRGAYVNRYTIVSDYRKAVRESTFPEIKRKERTLLINPSFAQTDQILEHLLHPDGRTFGCDIECLNDEVSCIAFAPSEKLSLCIPLYGDYWSDTQEAYIWAKMAKVFAHPKNMAIFHYAMFDTSFMWLQSRIIFLCKVFCTAIAHRVLYPDFSAKLQFVTSNYTDVQYYKDDKKIWSKPWVDPDRFYRYNAKDAIVLPEIKDALWKELEANPALKWTYLETMSNFNACLYMMSRGIQLDTDVLNVTKEKVKLEHEAKLEELNNAAEYPFSPSSPKQCCEYFYDHKGISPYTNPKTRKPTCDDKAMARIFRKFELPEARLVQECRALAKLLGTYLEVEYDADKRLRCFYDPRGTTSGRLSSSKTIFDKGLNFQNLDPRFKHFIVPDLMEE